MALPFGFYIEGPPVSQQAKNKSRRRWIETVKSVAEREWAADPPERGSVVVAITYFFIDDVIDVDNIPKPIVDAMNELVFEDDIQVTDLLCRKRNLLAPEFASPLPLDLVKYIVDSRPVLHISVSELDGQEVQTW